MRKNRIGYTIFTLCVGILLFFYSKPFLLAAFVVLLLLPVLELMMVHKEAVKLSVRLVTRTGSREGRSLPLVFETEATGQLFSVRSVLVEAELYNQMFGRTESYCWHLCLTGRKNRFEVRIPAENCGTVIFRCRRVRICGMLDLFSAAGAPFDERMATIYPRGYSMEVALTKKTAGAPQGEGFMQNRKGSDPSEMFDVREYIPGDDIRSIHWKLSSKLDELILRQSSDPSHYRVAVMPDLGRKLGGEEVSGELLNAAAGLCMSLCEQLLEQGAGFCMLLPTKSGLITKEIETMRELETFLPQWLSFPVPEETGEGMKYFQAENLEGQFTKLLIVSADTYPQNLSGMGGRVGILVISAVHGDKAVYTNMDSSYAIVEIPADTNENSRILC